jgi:hypothetical protein
MRGWSASADHDGIGGEDGRFAGEFATVVGSCASPTLPFNVVMVGGGRPPTHLLAGRRDCAGEGLGGPPTRSQDGMSDGAMVLEIGSWLRTAPRLRTTPSSNSRTASGTPDPYPDPERKSSRTTNGKAHRPFKPSAMPRVRHPAARFPDSVPMLQCNIVPSHLIRSPY